MNYTHENIIGKEFHLSDYWAANAYCSKYKKNYKDRKGIILGIYKDNCYQIRFYGTKCAVKLHKDFITIISKHSKYRLSHLVHSN